MLIGIATPQEVIYPEVSRFAREGYARELGATIRAEPDVFAYAQHEADIVGCFGLYRAREHEPLLLETYVPDAFERMCGDRTVERHLCAEIGTRAVIPTLGFRGTDISLGLSACLLIHAKAQKIAYLGFTSNRTALSLAKMLGIEVVHLGEPDLSDQNEDFRKNWRRFFRIKQYCFGFRLESVAGCLAALERLESRCIRSADRRAKCW